MVHTGGNIINKFTPAVFEISNPAKKRGYLYYYHDITNPERSARFKYKFLSTKSWHKTGLQPYSWNFFPPEGKRKHAILRIFVARDVYIVRRGENGRRGISSIEELPQIEIYRSQHYSSQVYTKLDEQYKKKMIRSYIALPQYILANRDDRTTSLYNVVVRQNSTGVSITNVHGQFQINIKIKNVYSGGAYQYFLDFSREKQLFIFVWHSPSVEVNYYFSKDRTFSVRQKVLVYTKVSQIRNVPYQGPITDRFIATYPDVPEKTKILERLRRQIGSKAKNRYKLVSASWFPGEEKEHQWEFIDGFVGGLPVIGEIYDAALIIHGLVYGTHFSGRKMNSDELIITGSAVLLGLVLKTKLGRNKMRNVARSQLGRVVAPEVLVDLEQLLDPDLKSAINDLDPKLKTELTELVEQAVKGGSTELLTNRLKKIVGKEYVKIYRKRFIEQSTENGISYLFRPDMKGFNNPILEEGYRHYISSLPINRNKTPLEWAKVTRGRYLEELRNILGDDFRNTFRSLERPKGRKISGAGKILSELTRAEIKHFDDMMKVGVVTYKEFTELNAGFGYLVEADHLFEQRFWRNYNNQMSAFDELNDSMCFLVPKNSHIASLLPSVKKIRFMHTEKTRMLRKLIPNGKENLFTPQQIWDAHVYTFAALDVDKAVYQERLQDMFYIFLEGLKLETGKKVKIEYRYPPEVSDVLFGKPSWFK